MSAIWYRLVCESIPLPGVWGGAAAREQFSAVPMRRQFSLESMMIKFENMAASERSKAKNILTWAIGPGCYTDPVRAQPQNKPKTKQTPRVPLRTACRLPERPVKAIEVGSVKRGANLI